MYKHKFVMLFTLFFTLWTSFSFVYQAANSHSPIAHLDKAVVSTCAAGKAVVQHISKICQDTGSSLSGILTEIPKTIPHLAGAMLLLLVVLMRLPLYPHVIDKPPRFLNA